MIYQPFVGLGCFCFSPQDFGREQASKINQTLSSDEILITSFVFTNITRKQKVMEMLKGHINSIFATSTFKWEKVSFPLLEATNLFSLSLCFVAVGCDKLPGMHLK